MNQHVTGMTVATKLINEDQAKCIVRDGMDYIDRELSTNRNFEKASLINSKCKMEFSSETRMMNAVFRSISMNGVRRSDRKATHQSGRSHSNSMSSNSSAANSSSEAVTDEKFALLFLSEFILGDMEFKVKLRLPLKF